MPMAANAQNRVRGHETYLIAIAVGIALFKGIDYLIQAALMPLETASVRLINALIIKIGSSVMLMHEPNHPLVLVVSTAVVGVLLFAIGTAVGGRYTRRG